jgi:hypothetical protein
MIKNDGTYLNYPGLVEELPPLWRQQRRLERQIAPHDAAINKPAKPGALSLVEQEKQVRKQIDQLLVAAGLKPTEGVTINGYDVKHYARDGQTWLNPVTVLEQLVAAGVDRELVEQILVKATEHGDPVVFATVKPMKGTQIRRRAA